jgi:integrase
MQTKRNPPQRSRGTGALITRKDAAGREVWCGKRWTPDGRQVKRRIGPKRPRGTRQGLTERQASNRLIEMMKAEPEDTIDKDDSRTLSAAIEAHLAALGDAGLKRSTARGYRSRADAHLGALSMRTVDSTTPADVEALDRALRKSGLGPQTRRNVIGFLGAVLARAKKKGWALTNPVAEYEKPQKPRSDTGGELQYLTLEEVEAVLRVMPDDALGRVERAIVLAAAMTGMRRGELLGLRWRDVLWEAGRLRRWRVTASSVSAQPCAPSRSPRPASSDTRGR